MSSAITPCGAVGAVATSRRMARVLAATLAITLLLTAAWLLPPLAIVVVWPLLFLVPGWALVAWVRPPVTATARLGLAITLSVAVSAHLVYWLAIAMGGYVRETIFVAAAMLALPIPLAAWQLGPIDELRRHVRGLRRAVRRSWIGFALAGLTAAFVAFVLGIGIWRVTASGVSSGGTNWSDLGVHLSIAQSLNAGNFPPQVPYFAGVPLIYHWFADFHAAIAARAAGIFSVPAMVVGSALLAGAFALLVHGLAAQVLRHRRAALIALLLAVFGGGLGYVRFIGDLTAGAGDPIGLLTRTSYDNQWLTGWPYFRIPSVMGTGLLAHRATTAGLPMVAGVMLLVIAGLPDARRRAAGWRDRPELLYLAGLLAALLAPFHFFFFPAVPLLVLLYVVASRRLLDREAPRNALLFLGPFLLAVPFAVAPLLQASGSGALKLVPGWESAPFADGWAAVAFFYLTNLGVPFALALVALFLPRTPRRAFLAAWVVALFLIPNLVQVSVISFDMNKYFQAMWIAVALLAGWLIRRWPTLAVAGVLLLSVPSPLLVSAWTGMSHEQVLSADELAAAQWVAANTPQRSVFVTDGWLNALTDPAGRLRLTSFGPYIANLGYSPDARVQQVATIYCGGDAAASVQLMRQLGATYVVDGGRPSPCDRPTDFAGSQSFVLVYRNPALRIFRLTDAAATRWPGGGPTASVSSAP